MVILGKTLTKQNVPKIIGISVIGLLALGSLVYGGLIWNEKQQFNRAEKEMDALTAQIIEKVGKPDQQKKEKSCGYASREFEKGPRRCGFTYLLSYPPLEFNDASSKLNASTKLITTKVYGPFGNSNQTNFSPPGSGAVDEELSQDLNIKINSDGHCGISYIYPLSPARTGTQRIGVEGGMEVVLTCGAPALAEYYPVTDK